MLAILAIVAFVIAAILELVKVHLNDVVWLLILGGVLISAHAIWGWYGVRYGNRTRAGV
jgi:hypothetical protein